MKNKSQLFSWILFRIFPAWLWRYFLLCNFQTSFLTRYKYCWQKIWSNHVHNCNLHDSLMNLYTELFFVTKMYKLTQRNNFTLSDIQLQALAFNCNNKQISGTFSFKMVCNQVIYCLRALLRDAIHQQC